MRGASRRPCNSRPRRPSGDGTAGSASAPVGRRRPPSRRACLARASSSAAQRDRDFSAQRPHLLDVPARRCRSECPPGAAGPGAPRARRSSRRSIPSVIVVLRPCTRRAGLQLGARYRTTCSRHPLTDNPSAPGTARLAPHHARGKPLARRPAHADAAGAGWSLRGTCAPPIWGRASSRPIDTPSLHTEGHADAERRPAITPSLPAGLGRRTEAVPDAQAPADAGGRQRPPERRPRRGRRHQRLDARAGARHHAGAGRDGPGDGRRQDLQRHLSRQPASSTSRSRRRAGSSRASTSSPRTRVSLIHFDDQSDVLATETVGAGSRSARGRRSSGCASTAAAPRWRPASATPRPSCATRAGATRTVLLLTDGLAVDEEECREAATALAALRARIIALGVGEEYNEDLLADLASATQGKPYDFRDMTALPEIFEAELGSATRQVVSDVAATVKTVRDVRLVSVARVYPEPRRPRRRPGAAPVRQPGGRRPHDLHPGARRAGAAGRPGAAGPDRRDLPGARPGVSRRDPAGRRDGGVHHRRVAGRLGGPRGHGLRPAAQRRQPGAPGDPAGRDEPGAGRQDAAHRPLDDPAARQPRHDGRAGQGRGRARRAAARSPSAPARRSSSGRGPRR